MGFNKGLPLLERKGNETLKKVYHFSERSRLTRYASTNTAMIHFSSRQKPQKCKNHKYSKKYNNQTEKAKFSVPPGGTRLCHREEAVEKQSHRTRRTVRLPLQLICSPPLLPRRALQQPIFELVSLCSMVSLQISFSLSVSTSGRSDFV